MSKAIAIIGHRRWQDEGQEQWAYGGLRAALTRALASGIRCFIGDARPGFGLRAVELLKELDPQGQAHLVLALPFERYGLLGRRFPEQELARLEAALAQAQSVVYVDEVNYRRGKRSQWDRGVAAIAKYIERTEWMLDEADYLIAGYDGRNYGHAQYATAYGRIARRMSIFLVNPALKVATWVHADQDQFPGE